MTESNRSESADKTPLTALVPAPERQCNSLGFALSDWQAVFAELGQPAYRAKQMLQWIHQRGVLEPAQMTDLPLALRRTLADSYRPVPPELHLVQRTDDGVVRFLTSAVGSAFAPAGTPGGDLVEAVLIPAGQRLTLCVSSQAGCALGCVFCETGRQGFSGDLSADGIVGQLWLAQHHAQLQLPDRPVSNVVFMGMGEPLLNLQAVEPALSVMLSDYAYGLAQKRVTVSTVGVVPGILALNPAPTLALSLHAATDELRNRLVPLGRKYPLAEVLNACRQYLRKLPSKRALTVEYTLLRDINDSVAQADRLADLLADISCKINLIPCNPVPNLPFLPPEEAVMDAFCARLAQRATVVTLRRPRGLEVNAACGQLAGRLRAPVTGRRRPVSAAELIAVDTAVA